MLIYSESKDFTEGIFGQCLIHLLEVLYYMENNNLINNDTNIKFDINTLNNGNLIPTFIKPKNICKIDENVKINVKKYKSEKRIDAYFALNTQSFYKANEIFNRYFIFNDFITKEISNLNISNNSVGIHYRGTDKNYDRGQANPITQDEMLLIIEDYFKNNTIDKIYCCSDEQTFIEKMLLKYPNIVIIYEQLRSDNSNNYAFFRIGNNHPNRDDLTNASIIDMLALSNCKTVIKSSSALSSFSKIINPFINLYTVCAMRCGWFPTAVAEIYKTDSEDIKNILKRTMKGDSYNK
jgi:hypothetical protein